MRWLLAAVAAAVHGHAAAQQRSPDLYQYVRRNGGGAAAQELHDVFHCDDGTTLVAGSTDSLSWLAEGCVASGDGDTVCDLTAADAASGVAGACAVSAGGGSCAYVAPVPSTELQVASGSIDNSGSSASRIGFVLALGPDDEMTPRHVSYFATGVVDSVGRIRASSAPGETTQALYISGALATARGSGYFIGKLDRNFVRGAATQLLWAATVHATGTLAVQQPWDVAADGMLTLAATGTGGWLELQRLGADGAPQVVEGWREHYNAAGELLHVTPASAAPTTAVLQRSVVVLESSTARCGLRSWSSADFNAFASDGNGGARRGVWPHDALMSLPCAVADPSIGVGGRGYTGLAYDTFGSGGVSSVVVDRRDGSVYVGLHAPSTTGSVPAVVAWSSDGKLIGWSRMMPETAAATAPVLEVAGIAIDYSNDRLAILARGRRTGVTPRYFWSDPSSSGFQNSLAASEVPSQSSVWSSWIGKYDLAGGLTLASATFVAELTAEAAVAGNAEFVDLGGHLAGFADPNQLPPSEMLLGDTSCHHLSVDSTGLVYVACTGIHTATTTDAHHAMWHVAGLGAMTGIASRNAFVRVYASDLSDIVHSSLITGVFDLSGTGGDNVELAAVTPLVGGLVVVATHNAGQQFNPIPTTNVTWGGYLPQPHETSGVIGRFSRQGLSGWPVTRADCPPGRESQLDGMLYGCSVCAAGRYAAQVNSPLCDACPLGTYSSAVEAVAADTCIQCPSGYAGASEAASDISQCVECLAGRMSNEATGYLCEDCAAGTYASERASIGCANCPRGKYSTVVASTSRDDCIACEAGRYGPDPGAGALTDCPVCPAGTWGDLPGVSACSNCAAGKASMATQATLESTCTDCAGGSISAAGADVCTPCPAGRFSSNAVSCALCPTGTYSASPGQSSGSSCEECAPGSYSSAGAETCEHCEHPGQSSQLSWGGCFACDGDSLPSFAAAVEAVPFSSLKFGTFPTHAAGNLAPFWTGDGEIDLSKGATSPGALYLRAGESATQTLHFSHTNQVPFVVGGFFAAEDFASGFANPPLITVTAHYSDQRTSEQMVAFSLEPAHGLERAGDEDFIDRVTIAYTSFEEPLISATPQFGDSQAQDSDHELVAAAPACTGAPAAFLTGGSCTGVADNGANCGTRFEAMGGSSEVECVGGDGAGCSYAIDCAARFAQQAGTTEGDCTGAEGAGCTYMLHNPVSYSRCSVAPGAELGFRSYYVNQFNADAGANAAHSIGVVGDSSTTQAGRLPTPHGSQYFEIVDAGSFIYVTLDTVPVSGMTSAWVQLWVHANAADWQADDFVRIWAEAEADGPADASIVDTVIADWDVLAADQWTEIRGSLAGMKTATISFGGATRRGVMTGNSEARALAFDFVRVVGNSTALDQRATWPLATVCPQPSLWLGSVSTATPPRGVNAIDVTVTARTSGHVDDVYATVDPRVACWCEDGYAWEQEYSGTGGCLYCSAGSFCTMGLRQTCPEPLISRGGQSECVECPSGFTCIEGEKSTCQGLQYLDDGGDCQPCPAGSGCVNAKRTRCAAGTWSDGRLNKCALCKPGQFQSESEATGCLNCPAGKTSTVGNSECFGCGAGETSVEGEACESCPVGRYSEVGVNTCKECPAGKFNGPGVDGLRAVGMCEDCPAGRSSTPDFASCE